MIKIVLLCLLLLTGCQTTSNPEDYCIVEEKRLVNGNFVEIYNVDRKCERFNIKQHRP